MGFSVRRCGSGLLIVSLFLVFPFGRTRSDGLTPRLAFTAEPAKAAFRPGEPVIFKFTLRNDDDQDISVSPALILNYDLHLIITRDTGEEIPWCGIVAKWVLLKGELATLHPGQTLAVSRQISCDEKREMGYSFSGAGEFLVSASYQTPVARRLPKGKPAPPPIAKGPYTAAPSRFTIGMKAKER